MAIFYHNQNLFARRKKSTQNECSSRLIQGIGIGEAYVVQKIEGILQINSSVLIIISVSGDGESLGEVYVIQKIDGIVYADTSAFVKVNGLMNGMRFRENGVVHSLPFATVPL